MADAGEIKAKVVIEYDGSGLEKAKEDLASLGDLGGTAESGIGGANDALAQFEEQAGNSAGSAKTFSEAIGELPKMTESGTTGIATMTDAMAEQQGVIEDTIGSLSNIQEPMKSYNESLQAVSDTMSSPHFTENMSAFQDALENPYPFQTIGQYLNETGQSWTDFTGTIGESNTAMLHEMATNADATRQVLGGMASDVQAAGKSFVEFGGQTEAFTTQFNSLGEAAGQAHEAINRFGGVGGMLYGPEEAGAGLGEILGGAMSDIGGVLGSVSQWVMPLMAFQMVGQVVAQLGQSIYDSAAIAEGPAAHSMGTFTGAVDALGQTAQKSWQQFSEGFGKGLIPTLDAANQQMSQQGGGPDQLGGILGGITGFIGNVGQMFLGLTELTMPGLGGVGLSTIESGGKGLINQFESWVGLPESFQGPGPASQNPMQAQIDALNAQANNPQYLAAQAAYQSAAGKALQAQQSFDVSHYSYQGAALSDTLIGPGGTPVSTQDYIRQELARASGDYGMAPAYVDPTVTCFIAGTRVLMADGAKKAIETLQIGERVMAHDGETQVTTAILARIVPLPKQVYELVFSDDNTLTLTDSHPIATTQGWKSLSPTSTLHENPELTVSTLQVGDHVCTVHGLCTLLAIHPRAVVQVYNLTVDDPHTFYANGVLVHNKRSISLGDQIANQVQNIQLPKLDLSGITSGISSALSNIGSVGSGFHVDVSGITSGITSQLSTAFSSIGNISASLPNIDLSGLANIGSTISSSLSSLSNIGASIHLPDIGGMISSALSGISSISVPNIGGMLNGAIEGMFSGLAIPSIPNIGAMLTGAMDGIFSGIQLPTIPQLGAMLTGAMSGMFAGIQLPQIPNIGAALSGALSSMLGSAGTAIPGFAGGVENFSGGPAFIAEGGQPELVMLPQGSSVYPLSTGSAAGGNLTPISLGGGGGGPQSINLVVQLDSQSIVSAIGLPLSQSIRVASGMRAY